MDYDQLAILNIGTNFIHLGLAKVDPDLPYTIMDRFKDVTRLRDGSFVSRRLSEQAIFIFLEVRYRMTLADGPTLAVDVGGGSAS